MPCGGGAASQVAGDADQGRSTAGVGDGVMATEAERPPQEQIAERTRVLLRPLAGPMSLGFLGLAGATFVVAGLNLGWVAASEQKKGALIVIAFTLSFSLLAGPI